MQFKGAPIVITGGAGFIGSHLLDALVGLGAKVRVLDNFSSGSREHLRHHQDRITVIEGDIRDAEAVRRACADAACIFHEAAQVSVPESIRDPRASHTVNIDGTLNVFEAARATGARVIYASSCAIYGDAPLPHHEGLLPRPRSPYALEKWMVEQYAALFSSLYGLKAVGLRYFNVYGPRQARDSAYAAVIPIFAERMRRGEAPTIYGDGSATRDFIHVKDVVAANLIAAAADDISCGVFNVATGSTTAIADLCGLVARVLGVSVSPLYESPRDGEVQKSVGDVSKAERELGFRARVSLHEGLSDYVSSL